MNAEMFYIKQISSSILPPKLASALERHGSDQERYNPNPKTEIIRRPIASQQIFFATPSPAVRNCDLNGRGNRKPNASAYLPHCLEDGRPDGLVLCENRPHDKDGQAGEQRVCTKRDDYHGREPISPVYSIRRYRHGKKQAGDRDATSAPERDGIAIDIVENLRGD